MTIEIFTIEDIKDQMADMFKIKLQADDLKDYLFIRSLKDSGITKQTIQKDFHTFLCNYGFIKPKEELDQEHMTHVLIQNIDDGSWSVLYSSEECLEDLYNQEGLLISVLQKHLDEEKHGPFRFLDFEKKQIELFMRKLH